MLHRTKGRELCLCPNCREPMYAFRLVCRTCDRNVKSVADAMLKHASGLLGQRKARYGYSMSIPRVLVDGVHRRVCA